MSEYRWPVSKVWVGVEVTLPDEYGTRVLVGVVRRSGVVQACGHFCFLKVPYQGKTRIASNAEARIFPFHSLHLDVGEKATGLELRFLGWTVDGNTPAFLDGTGRIVAITGAGRDKRSIPEVDWQLTWRAWLKKPLDFGSLCP